MPRPVDLVAAAFGLAFHPRLWAPVLAAWDRFAAPPLARAAGRASLWHVPGVPDSVRVHGRIHVLGPRGLRLGEHVRIGSGCFFHCLGGLTIGDNTQISRDVVVYTASHDFRGADAVPYGTAYDLRPVVIGKSVWIGMGVFVAPGVTIGDGAIIGMGAVISRDVPPGAIVVGQPQREVGSRDLARFRELEGAGRLFGRLFPDH